jgi:acetyltransferase
MKEFPHAFAARLTQIDYEREMALMACSADGEIGGVVRLAADPDKTSAEFAVMVRSDLKGRGLGYALMTIILSYARTQGIRRIFGDVMRENVAMLKMAHELGFQTESSDPKQDTITVTLDIA